jgi:predicted nucleic acid-binding Zn ribbon protein
MPYYDYKNQQGEIITQYFPMDGPLPPPSVDVLGIVYKRVYYSSTVIYNSTGFYTTDSMNSIDKWRKENLKGD